jgi:hypothetical protein
MTDENNNAKNDFNSNGGANDNAANRKKRNSAALIKYADIETVFADNKAAGAELKEKMEKVMDPIDRTPESFEVIIAYGVAPIEQLGKIAKESLRIQSQFSDQVKVMNIAMNDIDKVFSMDKMTEFGGLIKKGLKSVGEAGAKAGKGLFNGVSKLVKAISGADRKKTEEDKQIDEMLASLPQMYNEMTKMSKNLKAAEAGIGAVIKEAEKLGMARVEMVKELNVYLGAASEVERRYDEVYIPEAQEAFKASGDEEDRIVLDNIIKGRDNFRDQVNILISSRAQGVAAAQQLRMLMDELEKQKKIIQQFSTIRENEWVALLVNAGVAGSSLMVAQMNKKADQVGDNMLDMTNNMTETSHKLILASQGRGTVDPKKLLETLDKMQKMVEQEQAAKEKRYLEQKTSGDQILAKTQNLIDSVEKARSSRVIEAVKENEKPEVTPKTDASNDNKTEEKKNTGTNDGPKV